MAFFDKLFSGLTKTRATLEELGELFYNYKYEDDDFYDELEELLIMSDVGAATSASICSKMRQKAKEERIRNGEDAKECLIGILKDVLESDTQPMSFSTKPSVIMVVGVNGVGKTTTIGKLSNLMITEGKKVLLGAADTFRAAAAEQLEIWAKRSGAGIVRHEEGSDPASVVYDSICAAKSRGADIIIIDTAGRLHNKSNLMNELSKMRRIISREMPEADIETLMVLDATTGQNGLIQAKQFLDSSDITGIVLTKLDGTAKGGVVFAIANELHLPVRYVGVGEGIDDLLPFDAADFSKAILE